MYKRQGLARREGRPEGAAGRTPQHGDLSLIHIWLQIDAVSQFGETGKWLDVIPEHFSVRQWSKAKAEYRIMMAPEYAKIENGFEMAKMLPLFQKAVKEAETMQEPESISVRCIACLLYTSRCV